MWDPNIPGGGAATASTPEESSYAEERKRKVAESLRLSLEKSLADEQAAAAREASRKAAADEAANVAAMNEAAGQKNEYYQRADGSYAKLPEGYAPSPASVVAPRVLGAASSSPSGGVPPSKFSPFIEGRRFDEDQVPIAPQIPGGRVGEKILGPSEQAIADIARPVPEQGTGIRFAIGGKWYEQTRSGYVPVDQVKTDKGVQFNRTGPEASPEVMADIRGQMRATPKGSAEAYGAFGKALPADTGAGGFSPSPRYEDVAVLPQSALDDISGKAQMRGYENVLGDMEQIPDEALPPQWRGLHLTRRDARQLMLAQASHPAREAKPGVGPEALAQLQKIEDHYQSQKQAIEAAPEGQQKETARSNLEQWHADARRTATGWDEKRQLGI